MPCVDGGATSSPCERPFSLDGIAHNSKVRISLYGASEHNEFGGFEGFGLAVALGGAIHFDYLIPDGRVIQFRVGQMPDSGCGGGSLFCTCCGSAQGSGGGATGMWDTTAGIGGVFTHAAIIGMAGGAGGTNLGSNPGGHGSGGNGLDGASFTAAGFLFEGGRGATTSGPGAGGTHSYPGAGGDTPCAQGGAGSAWATNDHGGGLGGGCSSTTCAHGGDGGGGYYGGGGGVAYRPDDQMAGGGGGSGFAHPTLTSNVVRETGVWRGDGRIVVCWTAPSGEVHHRILA